MAKKTTANKARRIELGMFLLLFLFSMGAAVQAGVNQWTVDGPFGVTVTTVAINQEFSDNIYVGIDGVGVYYSDDGGFNWQEFNTGLTDLRVQTLYLADYLPHVEQVDVPVLYAGTNGGGIFRTDAINGSAVSSWQDISNDLPNKFILSFFAHPDEVNQAYLGTNGGGVYRSDNVNALLPGDVSWTQISGGLGNRIVFDLELPAHISNITINEVDAFGGNDFVEFFGLPNQSLVGYSLVLVDSLTELTGGPAGPFTHDFTACNPAHPSPAYATYPLTGSLDSRGRYVLGSAAVPGVDQVVGGFAIPNRTMGVALYAETLIDTWAPGDFLCTSGGPTAEHGYCFDDDGCGIGGVCSNPIWYATGLNLIDAVILDTGGGTSNQLDRCMWGDLGFNTQFEDIGAGNVARVPDGGNQVNVDRWTSYLLSSPDTYNQPLDTIWAATDVRGVYRTDDRGNFWVPFNNELAFDIAFDLAIDPVDPDPNCALSLYTTYVGTSGGGVFKNTDPCDFNNLDDWLPVSGGLADDTILTMAVAPTIPNSGLNSFIFAGSESGQIFRSHDNGGSWTEVSNGLGGLDVRSLGVDINRNPLQDPFRPSKIYSGTLASVYKTVDSGSNWFQTSPDLDRLIGVFVRSVLVDPYDTNTLYAGTFGGGVFQGTVDLAGGGDPNLLAVDWVPVNNAAINNNLFVWDLGIDATNDATNSSTIYAGTDTGGIFRTTDGGTTWTQVNNGLPVDNLSILEIEVDEDPFGWRPGQDLFDQRLSLLFERRGQLDRRFDNRASGRCHDYDGRRGSR